jgi:hypothetical protein
MATLIRVDGTREVLTPPNGTNWLLEEMQALVGGYIQMLRTRTGDYMITDEEGKLKQKPKNFIATALYVYGAHHSVVGDVLVIDNALEFNGPDEDDDDDDLDEAEKFEDEDEDDDDDE